MPCLEISVPKLTFNQKHILAEKLTKAMADSFELPIDIFGIKFNDYDDESTANGGVLHTGNNIKPYHHFVLHIGIMSKGAKQKAISSLTNAYLEVIGNPKMAPVIYIQESPYDNIGVEGRPLSER